jgi:hypothetical protein
MEGAMEETGVEPLETRVKNELEELASKIVWQPLKKIGHAS